MSRLVEALRPRTKRLTASERRQLSYAVVHAQPLRLVHRTRQGDEHVRVDDPHFIGPTLTGRVRGATARFTTDLLLQVSPVEP